MRFLKQCFLFVAACLCVTACQLPNNKNGGKADLELIAFYETDPSGNATKTPKARARYLLADGRNEERPIAEKRSSDTLYVKAQVRNVKRLSFVDLVVYCEGTGTSYVYNEGNGRFQCSSTTRLVEGEWVTDIAFGIETSLYHNDNGKCANDTYVEIQEISFLDLSGDYAKPNLLNSNVKTIFVYAENDTSKYPHTWGEWNYPEGQKQYDSYPRNRQCSVCNRVEHETLMPKCMEQASTFEAEYSPTLNVDTVPMPVISIESTFRETIAYGVSFSPESRFTMGLDIVSDAEVDDAVLCISLGCRYTTYEYNLEVNDKAFAIVLNNEPINYGTLTVKAKYSDLLINPCKEYFICSHLHLNKGSNVFEISSTIENQVIVDYLKLYSSSNLTWPTQKPSNVPEPFVL